MSAPLLVKLCGLRRLVDVEAAVLAGADLLGFVLTPSVRQVSAEAAAWLARDLPPGVRTVAVFHEPHPDELAAALAIFQPDLVQVEGDPALPMGTGRIRVLHDDDSFAAQLRRLQATAGPLDLVMLDPAGRGGQGRPVSRQRARLLAQQHRLLLAGGLSPDNVVQAVEDLRPAGVDVSSGIEARRGHKDPALITAFLAAARSISTAHAA